jgi:hypothetical protein
VGLYADAIVTRFTAQMDIELLMMRGVGAATDMMTCRSPGRLLPY